MRVSSGDRGQAGVVLLMVSAALFVALSAATVELGQRIIDRAQAQTAADAAALGAVLGGHGAARSLAHRHGATLVELSHGPGVGEVTVVVRLGTAIARAAASDAP